MNLTAFSVELERLSHAGGARWVRTAVASEVFCFTGVDAFRFVLVEPLETSESIRLVVRNVDLLILRDSEAWNRLMPFIRNAEAGSDVFARGKKQAFAAMMADLAKPPQIAEAS